MKLKDGYLLLPLRDGALAARPRLLWGWPRVERLLASSARGLGCQWQSPKLLRPGLALIEPAGPGPVCWLIIAAGAVYGSQSPGLRSSAASPPEGEAAAPEPQEAAPEPRGGV